MKHIEKAKVLYALKDDRQILPEISSSRYRPKDGDWYVYLETAKTITILQYYERSENWHFLYFDKA